MRRLVELGQWSATGRFREMSPRIPQWEGSSRHRGQCGDLDGCTEISSSAAGGNCGGGPPVDHARVKEESIRDPGNDKVPLLGLTTATSNSPHQSFAALSPHGQGQALLRNPRLPSDCQTGG